MKPFEHSGVWWAPGGPQVVGTLKYDGVEHPRLETIGLFVDLNALNEGTPRFDVILGTVAGKHVSLCNCVQTNTSAGFPGIATSVIVAPVVVIGAHVEPLAQLRFRSMSVSYDYLIEWTGYSAISETFASVSVPSTAVIRVQAPHQEPVDIRGASLRFDSEWRIIKNAADGRSVEQSLAIQVVTQTPALLHELLTDYFYHIHNFLTLGAATRLGVKRAYATLADPDEPLQVELIFRTRSGREPEERAPEMLFRLADLGDHWPAVLDRWIERAAVLTPIYDLFFSTRYATGKMYLQHRFLNLTQALESYHRRTVPGRYLSEAAFSEMRHRLEAVVGDTDGLEQGARSALIAKLKYFNEYSQRKRFKELLSGLGDLASTLVPSAEAFVNLVVNTRNYLTHYDEELRPLAAAGERLHTLCEQLQFLLEQIFLLEVGLDRADVRRLSIRYERYLRLRGDVERAAAEAGADA